MKPKKKTIKVGRIPFLVCAPFFHQSLGSQPDGLIEHIDGTPRELNDKLILDEIDCAPSSSFEYARNFEHYLLFPGISTSSRNGIGSVLLFSNLPWENLDHQPVRLSRASATSNILFQIISRQYFSIQPQIVTANQEAVGEIQIGDSALTQAARGTWKYVYELAAIWEKWKGLPFSFGLWMVRKPFYLKNKELVENYLFHLNDSVLTFQKNPGIALNKWLKAYPLDLPQQTIMEFFEQTDYSFGPEHEKSLKYYFQMAYEEGFLNTLPELQYIHS